MPELPADFDLKLMPDWLKEPASKNPYADYEGRDEDRRPRRDDWGGGGGRGRGDDRRGKPGGGGQRPGGPRGDGGRRDDRGRKDAPAARKPEAGKRPDRPASRLEDRRGKPGDQSRRNDERPAPHAVRESQAPPVQPANVTIEFFPDEGCAVSIGRQVKSTHRAYSLFDLARMFLARPERHRLKITTKSVAEPLYQVGEDGPVWLERAAAERAAFPIAREKYYVEVTEQREMPKGNFSNVARCRANGVLLGPTNYHGYQPALRRLYEERFSRRMSFSDFQREIEVVNDPALVEQWKQQSSNLTAYRLRGAEKAEAARAPEEKTEPAATEPVTENVVEGAETEAPAGEAVEQQAPTEERAPAAEAAPAAYEGPVLATVAEVEQHFREHFLPGLIREGSWFHLSGEASRSLADRGIAAAVRQAWEQERGFPGQMMHQLRQQFAKAGLHVFKHRKRMQFVSLIRPSPMENGSLSASVAEILQVIQGNQNCNRTSLAAAILGADESAMDQARKATLATDLRWLIETGRVIEFSDGRLELPMAPAKQETHAAKVAPEASPAPAAEAAPEPAAEAGPEPAAEIEIKAAPEIAPAPEPVPLHEAPPVEAAQAAEPVQEPAPAETLVDKLPEAEPAAISADSPAVQS
jgi:hypothetical protein